MSRNFRQAQLLDAFEFNTGNQLVQLAEGLTNIRSGAGVPTTTAQNGDMFFDTMSRDLYVYENSAWVLASSSPDLTGLVIRQLDALPKQSEYDYTATTLDIAENSSEDFLNSLGLSLVFNNAPTIAEGTTYYLFNTTPNPLTNQMAEPDVILTFPRFGYSSVLAGNQMSYIFNVDKGQDIIDAFVTTAPDIDISQTSVTVDGTIYDGTALFGTLYTRIESDTGVEVLTYNRADGNITWELPDLGVEIVSALPNTTTGAVLGEVVSLTIDDGDNPAGLYRRISITDATDAAWQRVGMTSIAAIVDNGGTPEFATGITAGEVKNLLDIELQDLDDVIITHDATDFVSIANPVDPDNAAAGDYTTNGSTFEIILQNAAARMPFVVGQNVAFTLASVALADVPNNILFTGTITISEQNLNLGERIVMTIPERYRSFFTGGTFSASADGFAVPASTIETWRAWSFSDSDLGVGVFNVHGDLSNQSIPTFRNRLDIPVVPDAPANGTNAERYVLNVPATSGAATWTEEQIVPPALPFNVTTTDVINTGTLYTFPSDPNDRNVQYQPNINTLIFTLSSATNITNGTVVALQRGSTIYSFIVNRSQTLMASESFTQLLLMQPQHLPLLVYLLVMT